MKKKTGDNIDISRLFLYYNARVKFHETVNVEDNGCSPSSAIEALEEFGSCHESSWAFEETRINQRPSDEAFQEASKNRIYDAMRVNMEVNEMKTCLAQGFPFAFAIKLFSSFNEAKVNGIVPMPIDHEARPDQHEEYVLRFSIY